VIRDAALVAGKDLRLEWRSRVGLGQVLPFALLCVLLFAFALDPDRGVLQRATGGLFWMIVLFAGVLVVQRSFSVEGEDGVLDALRLSGLSPASIYLGKVGAITAQLVALEAVLLVAVAVLYDTTLRGWVLLLGTVVLATLGIAGAGATYGIVGLRLRGAETLLPLLLLPLLAPVLIGATGAFDAALGRSAGPGWPWAAMLGIFAVVYLSLGALLFRPLMEDM
jgi:heme exporter protein B